MKTLMIYGATGYTGRMAAEHAKAAGINLVLAGRSEAPLTELATKLGTGYRVFALDYDEAIDAALSGISVLLNCAGPYLRTAEPLIKAAIRCGVDYLDTAAELDSYRLAEAFDEEAKAAGVMLLPGSGGSVAMLGSLAGHAAQRVADPVQIRIALHVTGSMSRGSVISATENMTADCFRLIGGKLVGRRPEELRDFDFGDGPRSSFPVTLPDLLTMHRATGVPDIETYVHVSGGGFPQGDLATLPDGPTAEQREANRYQASVEVTGADGTIVREVLDTVNGYTFTSMAAPEAARRVLAGERRPGFQTPAGVFGNGFAETIADTRISDATEVPPSDRKYVMTEAVEITTFRLAAGLTMKRFIAANRDIDAWLVDQPGFISRRICQREDGTIVDVLVWASAAAGRKAAAGVVTEIAGSPVHAAIDQSTVDWSVSSVHHAHGV